MHGVKLVRTPARNSSGSAVAGLPEKRSAICVKSTGCIIRRRYRFRVRERYQAHDAVTGHSSHRGTVYLQVSFPCSRRSNEASDMDAAFPGSSFEAASREERYVLV